MSATRTRTIDVRTSGTRREIEAFLYSHSRIVAEHPRDEYDFLHLTVETTADADRVDYLAQYQADRLCSGLHGATVRP